MRILTFIASGFAKEGTLKVPSMAEALRSFSLPFMAGAISEEEESAKARELVDSLIALGERTGAKVEIK